MIRFFIIAIAMACLITPLKLHGKAMSELNIKEFDKDREVSRSLAVKSPFSPARPSPQDLLVDDLILSGVVIGSGKKYALISGYVVKEGEPIGGLRVKMIMKNKVVLQYLDKVHTLYLEGGF